MLLYSQKGGNRNSMNETTYRQGISEIPISAIKPIRTDEDLDAAVKTIAAADLTAMDATQRNLYESLLVLIDAYEAQLAEPEPTPEEMQAAMMYLRRRS